MSEFISFAVACQGRVWNFMTGNWLCSSILVISIILPKIFNLVRRSIGKPS